MAAGDLDSRTPSTFGEGVAVLFFFSSRAIRTVFKENSHTSRGDVQGARQGNVKGGEVCTVPMAGVQDFEVTAEITVAQVVRQQVVFDGLGQDLRCLARGILNVAGLEVSLEIIRRHGRRGRTPLRWRKTNRRFPFL